MPLPPAPKLSLTDSDRKQLLEISGHRSTPRGIVLRIDIVLGAAEGIANHIWRATYLHLCRPYCCGGGDLTAAA